jgi:ABC-type dipeptide/oligopeptide/nickel transport system permease component
MYGFLVLFGVITVVFFLFHIKPGDPARMLSGQMVNEDILKTIRTDLGLDLPLYKRYLLYLNDLSPLSIHDKNNEESHLYLDTAKYSYTEVMELGDDRVLVMKSPHFRKSYRTKKKVSDIIYEALPATMILAVTAMGIATLFGVFLGVIAAIKKGSFFDNFTLIIAVIGMSAPSFFMALIISWIGGWVWYEVTWFPKLPFIALGAGLFIGIVFNSFRKNRDLFAGLAMQKERGIKYYFKNFSFAYVLEQSVKFFGIGMAAWFFGVMINGLKGYEMIPLIESYLAFPGTDLEMAGPWTMPNEMTGEDETHWRNLILPAITLGIRPLAIIMQLTRSSLLDVLSQDYVRTARAKGLSEFRVIWRHAMKNAMNPVVTAISGWFASLLAGAVFIENVFDWNGIGKKVFDAVIDEDFPVVVGSVLIIATMFVVINIIVDIVYGILDTRIRVK